MRVIHLDEEKEHSDFLAAQLRRLSDDIIVYHADTIKIALQLLGDHVIDYLIVDDTTADPDGLALREELREQNNFLPIIILSDTALNEERQYIDTPFPGDRFAVTVAFGRFDLILQWAIKLTARHRRLMQNTHGINEQAFIDEDLDFVARLLTTRECEILGLVTLGYTNQQIADELNMSYHTAKNHIHHIFEKLDIHSRAEAVRIALKSNIVK